MLESTISSHIFVPLTDLYFILFGTAAVKIPALPAAASGQDGKYAHLLF